MTSITLGNAIYIAIKPLFKIYLSIGLGIIMAKTGVLTPDGSRTVSQMILNFFLPCLIFANVVGNIKDTEIETVGVLILSAFIYFAIGAVWGLFVRFTTPIPKSWFGGLLVACIINNCGDLPIAYVQTLGSGSSFPPNSTSLGTAYSIIYNLSFLSFLFNFGGQRLIMRDAGRNKEYDRTTTPPISVERVLSFLSTRSDEKAEKTSDVEAATVVTTGSDHESPRPFYHTAPEDLCIRSIVSGDRRGEVDVNASSDVVSVRRSSSVVAPEPAVFDDHLRARTARTWRRFKNKNAVTAYVANFVTDLFRPQAAALIVAITIAMIPWVRRLFVDDPQQYIMGIPNAPDGKPPLDFLMDLTKFMGAAQVPLGLMLLGGTLARLKIGSMVRGFWQTVLSLTLFKLVILPIIAIAWTTKLRDIGWISNNDPMAAVILITSAATPCATAQIYLTVLASDESEPLQLNCVAVCLIVMYTVLPISLTIIMTYTIMNVL